MCVCVCVCVYTFDCREKVGVVLTELHSWISSRGFPAHFPVEVRFVKQDNIYLSPCYGQDSCYINIIMYRWGCVQQGLCIGCCCLLFVGCLTSQQHAGVSQGRICSDNFTCCHTEIEVADPTFYITKSQYTDTGPTSPSADPITPGAWQGNHWSANVWVTGMTRPRKNPGASGIRTQDLPISRRTPYH